MKTTNNKQQPPSNKLAKRLVFLGVFLSGMMINSYKTSAQTGVVYVRNLTNLNFIVSDRNTVPIGMSCTPICPVLPAVIVPANSTISQGYCLVGATWDENAGVVELQGVIPPTNFDLCNFGSVTISGGGYTITFTQINQNTTNDELLISVQ